ncbi:hypothetical protein ACH419_30505 [Streptomyces bobili]|uniref:hypothetical protein n=1 Tax=Streptomyces bobili TaxID=67280 RepID=UPI0037AD91D7
MALVAEAVLQVVAGRLVQSLHDDGTVADLDVANRSQGARFVHDGVQRRPDPGLLAQRDLFGWADVAQLPDAVVAVVVGLAPGVGDSAAGPADARNGRRLYVFLARL